MNTQQWLEQLVGFDTTSRNSNLELIHFIENWLKEQGIHSHLIHDPKEPKANLFATLPGEESSADGGLILSGHTDVVPVDGQDWKTPPFKLTEEAGKLFGRGTCDMKGFIAVVLSLVPQLLKQKRRKPVHLAFSYDEEIGCRGAPFMIRELAALNIKPGACIVGEPTEMNLIIAHKGIQVYRCTVHGVAAHSSLTTQGCNAIEYAAQLICYIRQLADHYRKAGYKDNHFDVPFTTLTTNLIKGGNAYNTIPALCELVFEFRHLPEDVPEQIRQQIETHIQEKLLPLMRAENPSAAIILDRIAAAPSFKAENTGKFTQLMRMLKQDNEIRKVAYATEAGLFEEASIPTLICGPGSINEAHRANEYVTKEQLEFCALFLTQAVHDFCS